MSEQVISNTSQKVHRHRGGESGVQRNPTQPVPSVHSALGAEKAGVKRTAGVLPPGLYLAPKGQESQGKQLQSVEAI